MAGCTTGNIITIMFTGPTITPVFQSTAKQVINCSKKATTVLTLTSAIILPTIVRTMNFAAITKVALLVNGVRLVFNWARIMLASTLTNVPMVKLSADMEHA